MTESADFSQQQIDRDKLLTALIDSFDESELRFLCFELRIYYDHLPPGGVADKARELLMRCERERRLPKLAEAVLRARPHIHRHSLIRDTHNDESPFKGLLAFEEADTDHFFGRDALIADLIEHLRHYHFLAIIGASGSGKSSVVRAGVVPALKGKRPLPEGTVLPEGCRQWQSLVITPKAAPLEELTHALTRDLVTTAEQIAIQKELVADFDSLHLHLRKFLERQDRSHLLLVVDQFEALFQVQSEPERQAFIGNLLSAVARPNPYLHLILTLRADFYHHCAQYDGLRQALASQQQYIGEMSRKELCQAIELPAQRSGLTFEPGLVELVLRDVGAVEGQAPEPGALPLLSHALLKTWQRREANVLTLAGYMAAGGVRGAIAKTAESIYEELTPVQQTIARNIFLRLTELGEGTLDTRRRAALAELVPQGEGADAVTTVLKKLADHKARLVTIDEDAVEVAHEALIREWPRLRDWLDEDREDLRLHRDLTEKAQEWLKLGRDRGALYRGARLVKVRDWSARHPNQLNKLESEFVEISQETEMAEQRERETARKLRSATFGLLGGAVGFSLAFLLTYASQVGNRSLLGYMAAMRMLPGAIAGMLLVLFVEQALISSNGPHRAKHWLLAGLVGACSFGAAILFHALLLFFPPLPLILAGLEGAGWGFVLGIGIVWSASSRRPRWQTFPLFIVASALVLLLVDGFGHAFEQARPETVLLAGIIIPCSLLPAVLLNHPAKGVS